MEAVQTLIRSKKLTITLARELKFLARK